MFQVLEFHEVPGTFDPRRNGRPRLQPQDVTADFLPPKRAEAEADPSKLAAFYARLANKLSASTNTIVKATEQAVVDKLQSGLASAGARVQAEFDQQYGQYTLRPVQGVSTDDLAF